MTGTAWTLAAGGLTAAAILVAGRGGRQRLGRVVGEPGGPTREKSARSALVGGRWMSGCGRVRVVVATVAGLWLLGLPLLADVGVVAAGVVAALAVRRRRAARLADANRAAVAELVLALAGELRAGRPPAQALAAVVEDAGPLASQVSTAAEAVRLGGDPVDEIRALARLPGADGLSSLAACWSAAAGVGAPVADVLEALVGSLDARARLLAELDAELAGSRATVRVLVALPLLGLALGAALGAPVEHVLIATPLGRVLLLTAGALDVAGAAWMRSLVRRAVPA